MIHILSYLIFFTTYAFFIKIREAYYYDLHHRLVNGHKDLHKDYTKERMCLLGLYWLSLLGNVNIISMLLLIPFSFLAWDFIADGTYFVHRNKLNKHVYKEKFKATESETSTSKLDKKGFSKNFKERKKLFIFANLFLITALIIEFYKNYAF
jgi:hypothetical protein